MKGGLRFAENILIFSILQGITCIPIKYIKDRLYRANVKYLNTFGTFYSCINN